MGPVTQGRCEQVAPPDELEELDDEPLDELEELLDALAAVTMQPPWLLENPAWTT